MSCALTVYNSRFLTSLSVSAILLSIHTQEDFPMAIGERIRFTRNLSDMTQKYLGTLVGFPEKTVDIRMAQYEAGTRTPKEDLLKPGRCI